MQCVTHDLAQKTTRYAAREQSNTAQISLNKKAIFVPLFQQIIICMIVNAN